MAKTRSTRTKKEPKYTSTKYIELEVPYIHPYTSAYVEGQYRGILKTKDEWKETLKSVMEDKQ